MTVKITQVTVKNEEVNLKNGEVNHQHTQVSVKMPKMHKLTAFVYNYPTRYEDLFHFPQPSLIIDDCNLIWFVLLKTYSAYSLKSTGTTLVTPGSAIVIP